MMLHTKYQGPRPCGFRRKDFSCFLGRALVRIRAKKEKNTIFGRALVRVRAKIEKITLFGRALIGIRAKIEKTPFLKGLWLA